ncbi:MAG: hypothetical protein ACOCP8_00155 [archaeon]
MKMKIFYCGTIIFGLMFISNIVLANTTALPQYPELQKIVNFIKFIISLIQWASGSVSGLIATVTGWQMLTAKDGNSLAIAKKNFSNAFWALFFIFGGSSIAQFFVNKLYTLLAS